MNQLENGMETHKVYLVMYDMCYPAKVNAIFNFFPRTPQL
jgi:hypothetical protein